MSAQLWRSCGLSALTTRSHPEGILCAWKHSSIAAGKTDLIPSDEGRPHCCSTARAGLVLQLRRAGEGSVRSLRSHFRHYLCAVASRRVFLCHRWLDSPLPSEPQIVPPLFVSMSFSDPIAHRQQYIQMEKNLFPLTNESVLTATPPADRGRLTRLATRLNQGTRGKLLTDRRAGRDKEMRDVSLHLSEAWLSVGSAPAAYFASAFSFGWTAPS